MSPERALGVKATASAAVALTAIALAGATATAHSQSVAAHAGEAQSPVTSRARSVHVTRDDVLVFSDPDLDGARRGSLIGGSYFTLLERAPSKGGCADEWFRVGNAAWLCATNAELTGHPPSVSSHVSGLYGLPYRYYFVGPNGSFGYSSLALADETIPDSQLEPGFAVAALEIRQRGEQSYALTTHGLWLPLRDLSPVTPSNFHGRALDPANRAANLDLGWVFTDKAPVYQQPGKRSSDKLERLTEVTIASERRYNGALWFEIGPERWLEATRVRRLSRATPPLDVGESERWIDVDTRSQVLTAYQGTTPVYATLVSTGKGAVGSEQATPLGEHRVWVKLRTSDMTNVEEVSVSTPYAIEEVPWVQFFKQGYGLHAAFWHDAFGQRRSHGCVNLSPIDAQRLFEWTSPQMPVGFRAIHPAPGDPGTRVVVR